MDRRNFFRISATALLPVLACSRNRSESTEKSQLLQVEVQSDMAAGHQVMEKAQTWPVNQLRTQYLIVGGGIAGMAAAVHLKDENFILCELSETLGGTSGSARFGAEVFSQGAHYDLPWPGAFGQQVTSLFEKLGVVHFNSLKNRWDFTDSQFMIAPEDESRSYVRGTWREDLLPETPALQRFFGFLEQYAGKLVLPTRLVPQELHRYNQFSFHELLQRFKPDYSLLEAMDYHMMDDYGGNTRQLAAMAGMYYYGSRPWFTSEAEIFSPPQGNNYFIEKMASVLPPGQLCTSHLVKRIKPAKEGFFVEVMDLRQQRLLRIHTRKVIYAGQKHALPWVFPEEGPLFSANSYAPWMVLNFVFKEGTQLPAGYWQSEMIGPESAFLGFVDSDAQQAGSKRVLTAYYCLAPEDRKLLAAVPERKQETAVRTLGHIARFFNLEYPYLARATEKVFIKVMGHAMPVPVPGFLFNDRNARRKYAGLVYAGVDNSRLPLMLEAADSGILAANAARTGNVSFI